MRNKNEEDSKVKLFEKIEREIEQEKQLFSRTIQNMNKKPLSATTSCCRDSRRKELHCD